MLFDLLARFRERRARVRRDAADLLTFLGEGAYSEARSRARESRHKQDAAGERHWSRVAVEIAHRTGIQIGSKVSDRYAAESSSGPAPKALPREVAEALSEIAAAIADVTKGRHGPTTVHNACARARQLGDRSPAAREASEALCQALSALAADPDGNADALRAGLYPERTEAAGAALQRLRLALQA